MLRYCWIAVVIIVIDQVTKYIAFTQLAGGPSVNVLPFLDFTLVFNSGAAFGLLRDAGGWQNAFFIIVGVIISGVLVAMLRRMPERQVQTATALALILGGALGNVIDRLLRGYVIDFVDVYYRTWHWPAFNVADAAITVGAILLLLDALGLRLFGPPAVDPDPWQ